jgi:Zn-dependent alcohol dehydrogenase
MSRREDRQQLALDFGATDIVEERGVEGVERIEQLTDGSAHTPWSRRSARSSR